MALKATIFKAELTVSDTDRGYYATHALTIARHPSETDERMMVRLLAFAVHAGESLQFTTGLSTEGEPDLWQRSPSNEIDLWIDVGLPDEKHLRRACGRARQVVVYAYGGNRAGIWWARVGDALSRLDRDCEVGGIRGRVILHHERQTQLLATFARQRQTNQATSVAGHEVNIFRTH